MRCTATTRSSATPTASTSSWQAMARRTTKPTGPTRVDSITHGDKRKNIPKDDANWSNRMILGDSLQVMASLAEREKLRGKVQMVYIDPPYGIKFGSNWQVSTRNRDVKDGKIEDAAREAEQIKAFRDTWDLG